MKTKLIELATSKQIRFNSQMFTDTNWKHSLKEDLRYYLWMCELQKWCRETHNIEVACYRSYVTTDISTYGCEGEDWKQGDGVVDLFNIYRNTYEQALEEGLYQTLLLIQEENGTDNGRENTGV